MKYLFIDLEFATTKNNIIRICEVGYVQTDENFNLIKKGEMIINPNIRKDEWDWYVVKKILTRKKNEYIESHTLDYYYKEIVGLIRESECVFGYCVKEDLLGLKIDPIRYDLSPIEFNCYDVQDYYMFLEGTKNPMALDKIIEAEELSGDNNYHNAKADAFNTMVVLKWLLNKHCISLNSINTMMPFQRNKMVK